MLYWMFLLSTWVMAKPNNTVLISSFEATGSVANETAKSLPKLLLKNIKQHDGIVGLAVSDMKPVHDQPPELYLESCPPGELKGCTFVLAEGSNVRLAVTGKVTALEVGSRVDVRIVDIKNAREVLAFEVDIGKGAEKIFAATVTRSLIAILQGKVGVLEDLREKEEETGLVISKKEIEELNRYTKRTKGTKAVGERSDVEVETRKLTKEMIQEMIDEEGSKEWDEYNMGPWEFMRYINSGLALSRWRQLMKGRQGQIITRVGLGVKSGPSFGKYYGRIARSEIDLSAIQTYAWQNAGSGTGISSEAALTVGILPYLDIGVLGGVNTGTFTIDLHSITAGQSKAAKKPDELPNNVSYVGGEINYVPMLISRFKPVAGLAFTYHFGRKATEYVEQFPSDLPDLNAANLLMMSLNPGLELRLSDTIDFWMRAPVSMVIYSTPDSTPAFYQSGGGALGEEDRLKPEDYNILGFGLSVGFQARIGPFGKKKTGLDIYE